MRNSRLWKNASIKKATTALKRVGLSSSSIDVKIVGVGADGKSFIIGVYDFDERSEAQDRVDAINEGKDSQYHIGSSVKKASLKKSPALLQIQTKVLSVKEDIEKLKGKNDPEVEKALDDATSSCDIVIHHLLDIYGE